MPRLPALALLAASLIAVGGCGAPDEPRTTSLSATSGLTTTTAPTTVAPPTTTTAAPPTTTPAAPRTTTSPARATTTAPRAEPVRAVQPAAPEPAPRPEPEPAPEPAKAASGCNDNYDPCVPDDPKDVDCEGGSGNGPSYVAGPVRVTGSDVYDLDRDADGLACE
ncbi:hypothetical protein [Pseudonocardia humida]|uniref:Excalibur calcium-binding domain-containing protein n=1 Tax=Pseudonocardia humida TaxID=2800819 RepID=A0ABT1A1M7_9PSEU|nr:hypothetical protein [Pseudonocardia humida]MCO1656904.1 hypothetical protein [Pseudonocardia humida]